MLITLDIIDAHKAPTCTNDRAYDLALIASIGKSYPIECSELIAAVLAAPPNTRRDREFAWVLYGATCQPVPASYLLNPRAALQALLP